MILDPRDLEECRVWMAETDLDFKDAKALKEILVFLVTLVYRVRKVCRDPRGIRDPKGTKVEGVTQVCQENQVYLESQDIQDIKVQKVILEAA